MFEAFSDFDIFEGGTRSMKRNMDIDLLMVTHKKIDYKVPDNCKKIQVNCANTGEHWEGYLHDDEGENISNKNPYYCELTALYWAWKNSSADIIGLCHYRRFFTGSDMVLYHTYNLVKEKRLLKQAITDKKIEEYMSGNDIIMGMPYGPHPRPAYTILCRYCYEKDIAIMRDVLAENHPEYLQACDEILQDTNVSYFNMMICTREFCDKYCTWLFEVLNEVEARVDISSYDTQHQRIYGYLGEILLNIYVCKNKVAVKYIRIAKLISEMDEFSTFDYIKTLLYHGFECFCRKTGLQAFSDFCYRIGRNEVYNRHYACLDKMEKVRRYKDAKEED